MHSKTLNEGRGVGHRHGAIEWYREQLICSHGNSVWVDAGMKRAVRQAQKVELSLSQMFPENCRKRSRVDFECGLEPQGPRCDLPSLFLSVVTLGVLSVGGKRYDTLRFPVSIFSLGWLLLKSAM